MLTQGIKEAVLGLGSGELGFIRKNYKNNVSSMKWSSINWTHECLWGQKRRIFHELEFEVDLGKDLLIICNLSTSCLLVSFIEIYIIHI